MNCIHLEILIIPTITLINSIYDRIIFGQYFMKKLKSLIMYSIKDNIEKCKTHFQAYNPAIDERKYEYLFKFIDKKNHR